MFYAQGDIIIEKVDDAVPTTIIPNDSDGAVVLARGEVTGHRHAFYDNNVTMFRDDGLARDIPDLYIGHVKLDAPTELRHEEHDTILLDKGTYRIRRQREWSLEEIKIVAD